ncbi:hypothetical protein LEP1GSC103_3050 [Leptospira borgpetersenii serovar Javanica str. UI 09931]|uniref:Uncharacterized protein n=5 Tax=Leptospira borgpetersenii TaxID=174 RepID=M3FJR8_LEPBO|nr:hypothetical protein LBBP_01928 [Leptospira borgpetersenii serovar Ballum]EKP12817.1 hypothetical protein LEP1GSC128_3052 [Leptospira borgpetersenii str. 200801926]EKQ92098.1 hypothetical protein LEP1GSC101_3389 [Leptospira borgpetersenii str. UI 09149]EKR02010.1 hypothetical protein LEP1GSC121_3966 [Leptospira borgpetersenii serovar Castellonis str. 200801910]EMG02058.1 hypothetical protein LEP1GSC123_4385 [Leptospira borgpetersenii str. 200701203]EMK08323.1 hypothetical protein LEP1GSC066
MITGILFLAKARFAQTFLYRIHVKYDCRFQKKKQSLKSDFFRVGLIQLDPCTIG